jgi:carboxylesterase type B
MTKDHILLTYATYVGKYFIDFEAAFTVDDYFLLDTPENLLKDPANSQVDLLIGNNRDEGGYLLVMSYPEHFNRGFHPSFTPEVHETVFRKMLANRPTYEQDAIITHYTHWENFNDGIANAKQLVNAAGDYTFVCPALDFARQWVNNGRKVYNYWFTHIKENSYLCGEWMGACHGSELEYTFGMPLKDPSAPASEKELSRRMQEYWVNFAKTGMPSANWLEYTPEMPVYLDINGTVISDITPQNIFGPRPDHCAFWNIQLPLLREQEENKANKT